MLHRFTTLEMPLLRSPLSICPLCHQRRSSRRLLVQRRPSTRTTTRLRQLQLKNSRPLLQSTQCQANQSLVDQRGQLESQLELDTSHQQDHQKCPRDSKRATDRECHTNLRQHHHQILCPMTVARDHSKSRLKHLCQRRLLDLLFSISISASQLAMQPTKKFAKSLLASSNAIVALVTPKRWAVILVLVSNK